MLYTLNLYSAVCQLYLNKTGKKFKNKNKNMKREFPGGLMVRIPGFHCHGPGSVPGWGTEIPCAMQHSQKNNFF